MKFSLIFKVVKKTDKGITIQIYPEDKRWKYKETNRGYVFKHIINGDTVNIGNLRETFIKNVKKKNWRKKSGGAIKIFGAKNIKGIKKLLQSRQYQEAFLSTHSILRRQLQVFVYITQCGNKFNKKNYDKVLKDFKNTKPLIDFVVKHFGWKNKANKFYTYNKNRNKLDHEIASFSSTSRDFRRNIDNGLFLLKFIDSEFKKLI